MRAWFAKRMMAPLLAIGVACGLPSLGMTQAAQNTAVPKPSDQQKPAAHKHRKKAKAEALAVTAPPVPTVAPNLLDQPATPATVRSANNELTVTAHNSSLAQILRQVSSQTGMKLDGMSADERVFGSFGPGATREVLTALLNGTSYNLIMVGDLPNGAPRELLLSRRSGGAAPGSPAVAASGNPNPNPNGIPGANPAQGQDQQPGSQAEQQQQHARTSSQIRMRIRRKITGTVTRARMTPRRRCSTRHRRLRRQSRTSSPSQKA